LGGEEGGEGFNLNDMRNTMSKQMSNKHTRILILSLSLLICNQIGKAQEVLDGVYVPDDQHSVIFQGKIQNALSKQTIDSVAIYVVGNGTNMKTYSDKYGNFRFSLNKYRYYLTYEKENYQTLKEEIQFAHVPDNIDVLKYLEPKKP
jgi:hypothetical protein